jgi:hypothetical protein
LKTNCTAKGTSIDHHIKEYDKRGAIRTVPFVIRQL